MVKGPVLADLIRGVHKDYEGAQRVKARSVEQGSVDHKVKRVGLYLFFQFRVNNVLKLFQGPGVVENLLCQFPGIRGAEGVENIGALCAPYLLRFPVKVPDLKAPGREKASYVVLSAADFTRKTNDHQ